MPTENGLLVECARTQVGSAGADRIRALLSADIDWNYVHDTAITHHVMPLLFRNLSRIAHDLVPPPMMARLQEAASANATNCLLLTRELVDIIANLERSGIPVLPYKGPVLATAVYGDIALRQSGDLDILVHRKDVERTIEFLKTTKHYEFVNLNEHADKDHRLFRPDLGITLECHWAIAGANFAFSMAPERLWDDLTTVRVAGRPILWPKPQQVLLMLCVHGTKHHWERLSWISDIAELVRSYPEMDWDAALRHAARYGGERMVLLGLALAHDLMNCPLPDPVLQRIEHDSMTRQLADQVLEWLFTADRLRDGLWENRSPFFVQVRERRWDKMRLLARLVLHSLTDTKPQDEVRLPGVLGNLKYVIRPVRLVWSYGLSPLQRMIGKLRDPKSH